MSLQVLVGLLNQFIGFTASGPLRLIHVVEYPKCGGTWVARMLRSYFGVDRSFGLTRLARRHSVIQEHCLYRTWYRRPVVVVRDPRDVWVSFYFHEVYYVPDANLLKSIGFDPSAGDKRNLESYVHFKMENPLGTEPGFSYAAFVDAWMGKPRATFVRYEDMHRDAACELTRLVRETGHSPIQDRIASSVAANSFYAITGREQGNEDRANHKRKGVVGDWRNHFTSDLSDFVLQRQGDLLRRLGYAADDDSRPTK